MTETKNTERLDALFQEKGWDAGHFKSLVFEGHDHNETCWAKRLAEPLCFLLFANSK